MSKNVSIALIVIWGMLAIVIGTSFLYSYLFLARAETITPQQVGQSLLASAYENQALDTIEQNLNPDESLEEFNPHGPISQNLDTNMALEDVQESQASQPKGPRPITTPLSFVRDHCPQPDELLPPLYDIAIDKKTGIDHHIPSFLVNITDLLPTKNGRQICLDEATALHLADLLDAAKVDGHDMVITSGYRSFATQSVLLDRSIETHGYEAAHKRVAPPGHSEHQLGTTIDLAAATNGYISAGAAFGESPEYAWMLEHAGSFGFVLSYPKGHEEETGYIFEPWHWRFVGIENVEKFDINKKDL